MNVVYVGLPNPIEVAAFGYPESAVTITTNNGTLKKMATTNYLWIPDTSGVAIITVWGVKTGRKNKVGESLFQAKYSTYITAVADKQKGHITKDQLLADSGIKTILPGIFIVKKYSVCTLHKGSFIQLQRRIIPKGTHCKI